MTESDLEPMPEDWTETPKPPRRPRPLRWIIAGVVGLAVVAAGFGIARMAAPPPEDGTEPVDAALQEEQEPPPPPLEYPMPTPAPLGDEAEASEAVVTSVETLIAATNEVLQRGDGGFEGIESVATGFVEGEVQALAIEREHLGYTQTGEATVTSVDVQSIDLAASPPTAVLEVCIDTSDLDVLDANGESVADQLYRPGHPVVHLYGAVYVDGLWRLSTHEIPDGATCG
ncbi:hypothetical protein [Agromyces sp. Marseille-P2726]|uniref:hypothetical protein n=1 Tax=Agromyces sp. Marseille-P2726 TaxID=2709132 RepID=UPI00156F1104|nr:hypothetical protein [Agromyces sp. Marseille-P2726]